MRISVVTPSYQQAPYLERTVRSVMGGGVDDVEHIVMDGGSTDGSVEILQRYPHLIWRSERDRGQTHAINKGLHLATGDILCWLNSDDTYMPGALARVLQLFDAHPEIDFIHAHCFVVDEHDAIFDLAPARPFPDHRLPDKQLFMSQPASFWRRRLWERVGDLDESYHYAMDFEYWLRIILNGTTLCVPEVLANFRLIPGTKSHTAPDRLWVETKRAYFQHGGRRLSPFHLDILWKQYVPRVRTGLYSAYRMMRPRTSVEL